jgi:hypothetical protein
MSVFTGGGPLSEPIRTIYRQLRRNLPVDADIMEKVEEIGSRPRVHSTGSKNSNLDRIRSQADALRRAFNRLYFIECNLLKFDDDELKDAREAFQKSKNIIEGEDSSLLYITMMAEEYLKTRRYFLCIALMTQETNPIGLPILVLLC